MNVSKNELLRLVYEDPSMMEKARVKDITEVHFIKITVDLNTETCVLNFKSISRME